MVISSNYHSEKVIDKKNVIKIVINKKLKQKKRKKQMSQDLSSYAALNTYY